MYSRIHTRLFAAVLITALTSTFAHTSDHSLMKPLSYQDWSKQLQTYSPSVVVVDMWAMWCVSCIKRFPEMVKLYQQYKGDNVVFVSMNLDDREDTESLEAANKFLRSMDAQFEHFRMDENLMIAFEKTNLISIPAVLIFDSQGNEKYRLTGDNPNKQFSEHDIELAIKALLAQ